MTAYIREVDRFRATSEDGLHSTVIVVLQEYLDASTLDAPGGLVPDMRSAETIDGEPCQAIGQGRFRVLDTDIILRKADD